MDVDSSSFLFLPLGGVGKIGMNVALYHVHGKWIMVDLGAGFADSDVMPGVDVVVADVGFISDRRDDLLGIVLTHAHEDHIGAIPYLWEDLRCPVYATRFTASFLKSKLAQFSMEIPVIEVDPEVPLELGPFTLEFVNMTHSIPEMHSIAVRTDMGSVLHTGDWKLDSNPVIGALSDVDKLKSLGDEGLLAVVSDSTNIFTEGSSGSEGSLYENILNIVRGSSERVAISLFASNVARICTLCKVAKESGRSVVALGRSLERAIDAAGVCGYLDGVADFLNPREARNLPRNKVLYLCTGCQGEPMAATARLADGTHPAALLEAGDTVVFSSKIIPGNEKRIFRVFNKLVRMGVEVVTEFTDAVHVSGHPSRADVRTLYSLTRPRLCIPVHGEYMHMYEHRKFAKECGIELCVVSSPGDVVDLVQGKTVGSVSCGVYGIDGSFMRNPDSSVMNARRIMRDAGIVIVTLLMNRENELIREPLVIAPGALDSTEDRALLSEVARKIGVGLVERRPKNVRSYIRNLVFGFLKNVIKGKPLVEVQLEYVW
ncbi:ribonuclease J [Candidatus Anaplasma sp. TIGMIC]|uniref:ribonuclease J n=1 Tax=Candidatus Anaplasma sp. TIGMIC TaxID=3020713 RepID=UPI00232E5AAC|nr:ribonuclease J [Candidatus Anaplasma sp. TIGMIC]MDB1135435.1 ribonuclease J [Candidatus Anaplasma sp. TIGMIC]